MSNTRESEESKAPRLFVRMRDSSGNLLCLMPMGIALSGAGPGKTNITQFADGVKVGNWRVEAEASDLADQFEASADALRSQMLLEAAKPASVELLLRRLVAKELASVQEGVARCVADLVGPEVERSLTAMAAKGEASSKAKRKAGA